VTSMNEEYGHISDAFDMLPEEELLITEEQKELYDTYTEKFLERFLKRFGQTVKDE